MNIPDVTNNLILTLTLPFRPITVNSLWKRSKFGLYKTKQAKIFQKDICDFVKKLSINNNIFPIKDPVEILYIFHYKNYPQDIDNSIKVLQDSLQQAQIILNDNLVFKITAEKKINCANDSINIFIYSYKI